MLPTNIESPTDKVPLWTSNDATAPLPLSSLASITVPIAFLFGLALSSSISAVKRTISNNWSKLIPFLEDSSKSYVAEIIFGFSTTTYDLEGDITAQNDEFIFNKEDFDSALNDFLGDIDQIPPIYSAIKVNGRKLYDYARSNQTVEIPSRKVRINKLERVSDYYEDDYKKVKIEADVSKGTYIRSLCKDIGDRLHVT